MPEVSLNIKRLKIFLTNLFRLFARKKIKTSENLIYGRILDYVIEETMSE